MNYKTVSFNLPKLFFLTAIITPVLCVKEYTLNDLVAMAKDYNEDVLPTNKDYLNPDFTRLLRTFRPTPFNRIATFFGFKKNPFSIKDFIAVGEEVVTEQRKLGRAGNYIAGTQLQLNDKIIIFGNLQGAFHSLIRDLQELVRLGIINNNLKILNERNRIIFNGDVITRSPYILQTLFVVLLLMKQNPHNVFLMETDVERDRLWKQYGIAEQLNIVYNSYGNKVFSLFHDIIDVSPFAFYGNYDIHPERLLQITAIHELESDITEGQTGDFFFNLNKNIKAYDTNKKEKSKKPVYATVIIRGNFKPLKDIIMKPATLLPARGGASIWQTFSAATPIFEKLYGYNQDSFVIIVCGKELHSSILEVYSRDRLIQDSSFKLTESYKIDTGVPEKATHEALMSTQENIYIGCSLDLSKSNYIMGDRLRTGIALSLTSVNSSGGVDSKKTEVQAVILDDEYTPALALANLDRLKEEYHIRTILLPVGTPTVLAAEDLIKSGELLVAFPVTGSPELRKPDIKGVVHFRPSFEYEVEVLLKQLIDHDKLKSFAFFFPEDEYGLGCMKKAKEVLASYNITKWVELPYKRNTTDFSKELKILESENIEALGCFSASLSTQDFLRQAGAAKLSQLQLFALAWAVDDVLESFIKNELGLKFLLTRDVPNPKFSQLPIVQEYRELMDAQKKPYDAFSLEGFICTSILCDMMKKVTGPITYQTVLAQFEAIKDYNYKGLLLNFNPEDRQISKRTWLDFQDGGDWKEVPI